MVLIRSHCNSLSSYFTLDYDHGWEYLFFSSFIFYVCPFYLTSSRRMQLLKMSDFDSWDEKFLFLFLSFLLCYVTSSLLYNSNFTFFHQNFSTPLNWCWKLLRLLVRLSKIKMRRGKQRNKVKLKTQSEPANATSLIFIKLVPMMRKSIDHERMRYECKLSDCKLKF